MKIFRFLVIAVAILWCGEISAQIERKQLFNYDWRFKLDKATEWQSLDLPHDWSVEGQVEKSNPMGTAGGYFPSGVGVYEKSFKLGEEYGGKHVALYFEGSYMNNTVYINGDSVLFHPYGYTPFYCDITPYIKIGEENVVKVVVDNSEQVNCRWYSGSGIYRNVWLITTDKVHIANWGVGIETSSITNESANVNLSIKVKNHGEEMVAAKLVTTIYKDGVSVGKASSDILLSDEYLFRQCVKVDNPELWDIDNPQLYSAEVKIVGYDDKVVDCVTEKFGIRTIEYSAKEGLKLNGRSIKLNGGCIHHDNGAIGAAAYRRAEIRKAQLMKSAGFNAIRTSHNPQSEWFMEACDSLGLLVVDEVFDGWRWKKTQNDYAKYFDEWYATDVEAMVLRDRNHPSIFCWSTGNEIYEREAIEVISTAKKLKSAVLKHDTTRPVTFAIAHWPYDNWYIFDPLFDVHEIAGYNYQLERVVEDSKRLPERIIMQTESYPRDAFANWNYVMNYNQVLGDFVWTGIDYLGESGIGRYYYEGETPGEHWTNSFYPWHGAYCGDIDLIGWRKPISHYREMLYSNGQSIYIAVKEPDGYFGKIRETMWSVWPTWESWNWPGHEGKEIEVEVYSKYPSVRLYLNGKLVGEKATGVNEQFKATFPIPYQKGTLRAVAVVNGKEVESTTLKSAGKAAKIVMKPSHKTMSADGQDLIFVNVEIHDANGIIEPNAENRINFTISGEGTILATSSANLQDCEKYTNSDRKAWKGQAFVVIKSTKKSGKVVLRATSPGLKGTSITLHSN